MLRNPSRSTTPAQGCIDDFTVCLGTVQALQLAWLPQRFAWLEIGAERRVGCVPRWTPARCPDRLLGGALAGSTRLVGCRTQEPRNGPLRHRPPHSRRGRAAPAAT